MQARCNDVVVCLRPEEVRLVILVPGSSSAPGEVAVTELADEDLRGYVDEKLLVLEWAAPWIAVLDDKSKSIEKDSSHR